MIKSIKLFLHDFFCAILEISPCCHAPIHAYSEKRFFCTNCGKRLYVAERGGGENT